MGSEVLQGKAGTLRIVLMVLMVVCIVLGAFVGVGSGYGTGGLYGGYWGWAVFCLIVEVVWVVLMYVDVLDPKEEMIRKIDGIVHLVVGIIYVILTVITLLIFIARDNMFSSIANWPYEWWLLFVSFIVAIVASVVAIMLGLELLKK